MRKFEQIFLIVLSPFRQNYIVGHGSWTTFQNNLKHPNHKKSPPFQSKIIWVSNEKNKNLSKKLFSKCNGHSK